MGKQKYKRNNRVPQAYQKVFAADDDRAKIWTLGKTSVSPVMKPISKVAV
jgi:hypothetical protein